MAGSLHPAENRGYRELYAFSRQLVEHWSSLATLLGATTDPGEVFRKGVDATRELLAELEPLTASYGLHGKPAAQGAGAGIARQRVGVRDRFLERNQGLRFAVEDMVHITTLLGYLGSVAGSRRDAELVEFCERWERKLRRHESAARKAAAGVGADPDGAIEPLHRTALGRVAHGVNYAVGTAGEWIDRRSAKR